MISKISQVSLCSPRDPSSIVDMYCDDEFALSLEFHPNMLLYPVQGVTSMEAELGKIDGNQPTLYLTQALLFRLLPVNVTELNPLEPGEQLRGGGGGCAQHAQCQPPKLLLSQKQPNYLPTKTSCCSTNQLVNQTHGQLANQDPALTINDQRSPWSSLLVRSHFMTNKPSTCMLPSAWLIGHQSVKVEDKVHWTWISLGSSSVFQTG